MSLRDFQHHRGGIFRLAYRIVAILLNEVDTVAVLARAMAAVWCRLASGRVVNTDRASSST